jgi:hypothetical protein
MYQETSGKNGDYEPLYDQEFIFLINDNKLIINDIKD